MLIVQDFLDKIEEINKDWRSSEKYFKEELVICCYAKFKGSFLQLLH